IEKLNWFNQVWSQKLYGDNPSGHPLYEKITDQIKAKYPQADKKLLALLWPHMMERYKNPGQEILPEFEFFFTTPNYEASLLVWKKSDAATAKTVLIKTLEFLQT